ncbi:MAG: hypothetical protein ABIR15_12105, partial [Chitinophagaceae bacterium]
MPYTISEIFHPSIRFYSMRQVFYTVMAGILLFSGCSKPGIDGIAGTQATMFREHGLDVDWDHSGSDRIAFSAKGSDGYYDVHTANPDGSQDSCITCNLQPLTQKHIAAMAWHPSGEWLVVAVEKLSHPGSSFDALPGLGSYTDLWLINRTATKYYKILEPPVDADHGVIIPKFSHDGKKLTWTDRKKAANILVPRQTAGYWTIKVADFAFDWAGTPLISNIKTIEPESDIFIEGYGFSPDDKKIIFCS